VPRYLSGVEPLAQCVTYDQPLAYQAATVLICVCRKPEDRSKRLHGSIEAIGVPKSSHDSKTIVAATRDLCRNGLPHRGVMDGKVEERV